MAKALIDNGDRTRGLAQLDVISTTGRKPLGHAAVTQPNLQGLPAGESGERNVPFEVGREFKLPVIEALK